jgi:sarcosine oxidase subunit gamma
MFDLAPSSPLSQARRADAPAAFAAAGVTLHEEPALRVVLLFDKPQDPGFRERVMRAFGVELPATPNTVAVGANSVAWIAPDQWLAIGTDLAPGDGIDVSDAYCAIGVSGARTLALLSKSVPIDLAVKAFAPHRCARTLLGSIPILLMARDEGAFLILVERGLAHAAWTWLVDGASSFSG